MLQLTDDIFQFLCNFGITASRCTLDEVNVLKVSCNDAERIILPVGISATAPAEAQACAEALQDFICRKPGSYPLIIPEDRWRTQRPMMEARLLAHLEIFIHVYARNCEVRRIDKTEAAAFLADTHSYGNAACRYRYGLFVKRHTGSRAQIGNESLCPGTLIAVATFSNARKWMKGEKAIRSYEWIRYASLPGVRVSGGMGKLLKAFIEDVQPDDIMSYADLEWSEGAVYEQLGFGLEGRKDPVMFEIDSQWKRSPVKLGMTDTDNKPGMPGLDVIAGLTGNLFYMNFGSNKYRLKLTEYE